MPKPIDFLPREKIIAFRLVGVLLFVLFALYAVSSASLFVASGGWAPRRVFWNILTYPITETGTSLFFALLSLTGLALALGKLRDFAALFLLYGWFAVAGSEINITELYWPYIGWTLLAILVYRNERRAFIFLRMGAWAILGLSFSASGTAKFLESGMWINGNGAGFVLLMFCPRLAKVLLNFPMVVKVIGWMIASLEFFALPLALFQATRFPLLCAVFAMHFFIGVVCRQIVMLSWAMMIFYYFLYEITWGTPRIVSLCKQALFRSLSGFRLTKT